MNQDRREIVEHLMMILIIVVAVVVIAIVIIIEALREVIEYLLLIK